MSVAVLDGTDIVYVARAAARRIMSVRITSGTQLPAAVTSMGRVLLAALPESESEALLDASDLVAYTPRTRAERAELTAEIDRVRAQGWSMVDGEREEGLRSIAIPLLARVSVVAALNVSTSSARGEAEEVRAELLPALQKTASDIDAELRAARI